MKKKKPKFSFPLAGAFVVCGPRKLKPNTLNFIFEEKNAHFLTKQTTNKKRFQCV